MSQPNAHPADDEEDLNRAINELRGVLSEDARLVGGAAAGAEAQQPDPSIIMNIPVDVQIVLGSTEMQVSDLMSLRKGATVALNRRIGEPVDVMVNGRRIARGEIVVLESDATRFGIKLTEIISNSKAS